MMKIGGIFLSVAIVVVIFTSSSRSDDTNFFKNGDIRSVEIKSCEIDADCGYYHKCVNKQCMNICKIEKQGNVGNSVCRSQSNHTAIWRCPEGYDGDSVTRCTKNCTTRHNCFYTDVCYKNSCIVGCDTIKCEEGEKCLSGIHNPHCVKEKN